MTKIAIVTGATRLNGIGAAICKSLAQNGIDIFFTYWPRYDKEMPWSMNDQEPFLLKREIENFGVRCEMAEVNLAQSYAPNRLLYMVSERLGEPSILINNAAYSTDTNVEGLDVEQLDKHYTVNVRATMLLSTLFIKNYTFETSGSIVNLTSGQSLGPMPNELAYIATKGAIEAFTTSVAPVAMKKGITVNAVDPGPTNTGWMTEEMKAYLVTRFPAGRIGESVDVARLITFLVSEEAKWITGQIIHSNGGFY
ncbi:SDR family oxidoreductase [Bacillus pseudomycoides]|uniref:SDR family oxidoreductase n=1 Tax=Bacillus pseudomycoides TaxID=64104 RepID=UPI000BF151CA|nr:SDR family oxidoreductase [Bacillus pseudomycoides]PEI40495.1 3-ketoacyl-ACP reductase [Bacillus pseudomycoides]PGA65720.1 3-ketoacyl-ACP reductase [Bacillus pseudomycoides]PHE13253.1 3-ketoacyl-ACP reductase [Bacillus pseudomycoides]PHE90264.1 3-ketoacyl-ACP reductase [Bacillus pseudomycoides]